MSFKQIIVLEKGGFTPAAELSLREGDSFEEMYEMGSLLTTQDAGQLLADRSREVDHACSLGPDRGCRRGTAPISSLSCRLPVLLQKSFGSKSSRARQFKQAIIYLIGMHHLTWLLYQYQ
jgi:hypothetical protein